MRSRYRSSTLAWNIILVCFMCGAFSIGFFCGLINNHWSDQPSKTNKQQSNDILTMTSTPSVHTSLIVIILSKPSNFQQRKIIRETWLLTGKNLPIRHFFVVGSANLDLQQKEKLESEQSHYNDLLMMNDIEDVYDLLTAKVLRSFLWVYKNVNFTFLLKVDDDSFARLDEIFSQLNLRRQTKSLYLGFFDGRARIKKQGQWTEHDWFLCDRYLPYAQGGGYVLTRDLVEYVAKNWKLLQLYKSEDVSVGVWLAPVKLTHVHDNNFDTEYQSRGCYNSYLVTHKQTLQQMKEKYNNLIKFGRMCKTEYRSRLSYVYNWKTLPSLCCHRNNNTVP